MHTKVFGKYNGTEEVMMQTPLYTEINIIDNYAETAKVTVTVKDKEGKVVSDARVEFKVYNYAEFYTVANKKSDEKGQTFLTAGKGDMLVWASKDGCFGFSKVSFGKDKEVTLVLDKEECAGLQIEMDIVPPSIVIVSFAFIPLPPSAMHVRFISPASLLIYIAFFVAIACLWFPFTFRNPLPPILSEDLEYIQAF